MNDRLNFLTPITVPVGYHTRSDRRHRRLYDSPATPFDRLVAAGTLSLSQQVDLLTHRDGLDPHTMAKEILALTQENDILEATNRPPDGK